MSDNYQRARLEWQADFHRRGGVYAPILDNKYETGELDPNPPFKEYPKHLPAKIVGKKMVERTAQEPQGPNFKTHTWTEEVTIYDPPKGYIEVHSREEELRIISGGRSDAEMEDYRQELLAEARAKGINCDNAWDVLRIQQALNGAPSQELVNTMREQLDQDRMTIDLMRQLAETQREMDRMRQELASYRQQQVVTPVARGGDDVVEMRRQLAELGAPVDLRWGPQRLREALEAATAPGDAV